MSKIRPPEEVAELLLCIAPLRSPDAELLDGVTSAEFVGVAVRVLRGRPCFKCGGSLGEHPDCVVCWIARMMEAEPRTVEELEQAVAAEMARPAAAQDEPREGGR